MLWGACDPCDDVQPHGRARGGTDALEETVLGRGLPRGQQRDHRQAVAVDELVDLRREAAAGAGDRVIRRLVGRIRVVRSTPVRCFVFVAY